MRKLLLAMLPVLLLAANFKLYLKDGNWHLVREYKVEDGRVRFYSVERSEWEEIPVEMADLKRTEAEVKEHADARKQQAKLIDEEEKAERAAAREISNVPQDPGVYYVDGKDIKALKPAEAKVNSRTASAAFSRSSRRFRSSPTSPRSRSAAKLPPSPSSRTARNFISASPRPNASPL
ncbi:MAG: hypothetical protein LC126_29380 [Bryobacterales bacterium]|nr:hypothetical protein [Bryobacterales bacterium]